jgi:hypothetical protein
LTTNVEPTSNLHELYEALLLGEGSFPHQSSGGFRPSEASAVVQTPYGTRVLGHCARATWYRLKKVGVPDGQRLPHQVQRMENGTAIELHTTEILKRGGLFGGGKVYFRVTMDGVPIAAELDIILRTTPCGTTRYVTEMKTIYSYNAQKEIFGRGLGFGGDLGKPKDSHLMQLSLYLNHFSRLPKEDPSYLPFGALFYNDRGDGHFGVYDVWLEEEGRILNEDETIITHRPYYKSSRLAVPPTPAPYTVEDILSRWRMVMNLLQGDTPPPRDFVKEYSPEEVEKRHAAGEISKSAYEKWAKSHGPRGKGKETIGAWNCFPTYCNYSGMCWGEEG